MSQNTYVVKNIELVASMIWLLHETRACGLERPATANSLDVLFDLVSYVHVGAETYLARRYWHLRLLRGGHASRMHRRDTRRHAAHVLISINNIGARLRVGRNS